MYGDHVAGGDLHFFEMAEAARHAGYHVNFFGGHALQQHVQSRHLADSVTLTDQAALRKIDAGKVSGQATLFLDYFKRFFRTLPRLKIIKPNDVVYATTDYWFDVLPAVWCRARRKMMIWHMAAPTFLEIVRRSRADVDRLRVASLHYWVSQNVALSSFRDTKQKRLLYVHPAMRRQLLDRGYASSELKYIPFGVDPSPPGSDEPTVKEFDIVWIGRVHRQKGIDDLLQTLHHLSARVPGFRAVIIGKVQSELEALVRRFELTSFVTFSGFVSEAEKFRLFRKSRVYLMPSRFEGSPRVIGEALVCGLPVLAYDVPTYRPVFGSFLQYVPCYDIAMFKSRAEDLVMQARQGQNYLAGMDLAKFKTDCSWPTARSQFLQALSELEQPSIIG